MICAETKDDRVRCARAVQRRLDHGWLPHRHSAALLDVAKRIAAAEQAEAAYKLSRERYDSGLVDLIAVMDSQQRWFIARSQVLIAKKNKIDTRLNLLLAFGGNT